MKLQLMLAASAALVLAACQPPAEKAPEAPAAPEVTTSAAPEMSIPPAPTVAYTCERGTKIAVKLTGPAAEVAVNGAEAVSLPALGEEGTTFTNGRLTLTIVQGKVSIATGRAAAEACTADPG